MNMFTLKVFKCGGTSNPSYYLLTKKENNIINQPLVSEYKSIYTEDGSFYRSMIKSSPMNVFMPKYFLEFAEKIWNFVPRKDDVWILTYPKCGTTLTAEIMWQIANGVDLDSEKSKQKILLRSPWIEFSGIAKPSGPSDPNNPM